MDTRSVISPPSGNRSQRLSPRGGVRGHRRAEERAMHANARVDNSLNVVPANAMRTQGPIPRSPSIGQDGKRASQNNDLWLWAPASAGATARVLLWGAEGHQQSRRRLWFKGPVTPQPDCEERGPRSVLERNSRSIVTDQQPISLHFRCEVSRHASSFGLDWRFQAGACPALAAGGG